VQVMLPTHSISDQHAVTQACAASSVTELACLGGLGVGSNQLVMEGELKLPRPCLTPFPSCLWFNRY
jgi:hypothetical protein